VKKGELPTLILHINLQGLSNEGGWDNWYYIKSKINTLKCNMEKGSTKMKWKKKKRAWYYYNNRF
jgi:hypothetical protein